MIYFGEIIKKVFIYTMGLQKPSVNNGIKVGFFFNIVYNTSEFYETKQLLRFQLYTLYMV